MADPMDRDIQANPTRRGGGGGRIDQGRRSEGEPYEAESHWHPRKQAPLVLCMLRTTCGMTQAHITVEA